VKTFQEFRISEDSNGSISAVGDNLVSKYITIKGISKIISSELEKFDKEKYPNKKFVSRGDKSTWEAKSDFTNIEIHFTTVSKDVQIGDTEMGDVTYTGVITINPLSAEIKSKIEVK
jgi:hypothetical protein